MRMLLGHRLARARKLTGEKGAAAEACDEVLRPRVYQSYRAVLLPDCLLWTAESAADPGERSRRLRQLVDAWRGPFEHPSVKAARELLSGD